jgi:tetratricopeptide (TPR) repeat protein
VHGDLAAARAAGEKSIALNPNDAVVVFHYASHLIATGEIERGNAILRQVAADSAVRPTRLEFSQFLAAYLTGDVAAASYHAAQMTIPTFTLGHLARTLAAVRADNLAAAQQSAERLVALQPAWKSDPRGQLRKFFATPKIVDQIAADLALVGIGAAQNADVSAAKANPRTNAANSAPAIARPDNRLRSGSGMPTIYVEPFATTGTPTPVNTEMLRNEVADALGRFDDVEVVSEESRGPIDFRLTATLQFRNDHSASLTYRLLESGDASVIWSRTFDDFAFGEDGGAARKPALRELATTLAQPTGAIHSRARERRSTMEDRRYRCFLKAVEFWHNFESGARARARACFEEMTAIDPNFAVGFSSLALIYLVEHQINLGAGSADRQGLERAVHAAQRAVEVKPKSAMAQAALMEVMLARHEIAAGHEAGVKAIEINPFDIDNLAVFGARLLGIGDIDTGAALLREASDSNLARPPTIEFCLFLGGYLTGDWTTATRHADRITIDTFPPGLIARALTAAANGDRERSAAAIARLIELNPDWGTTPRRMLANLFVSPLIVDWLARGLAEAGLRDLPGSTADNNTARP